MKRLVFLLCGGLIVFGLAVANGVLHNGEYGIRLTTSASANASAIRDTFQIPVSGFHYKSYNFRAYIGSSTNTAHNFGASDTGVIVLKTFLGDAWYTMDSSFGAIPCSLISKRATPVGDTAIRAGFKLIVYLADSTDDTVMNADYRVKVSMTAKE